MYPPFKDGGGAPPHAGKGGCVATSNPRWGGKIAIRLALLKTEVPFDIVPEGCSIAYL